MANENIKPVTIYDDSYFNDDIKNGLEEIRDGDKLDSGYIPWDKNPFLSGITGLPGISGDSGYSGYSGFSGFSGQIGISGFSGYSGISGFSGYSGISGFSGYSGEGTTDHLLLNNLNNGDGVGNHTNAFNLLGRAGGQTAIGGTLTSNTLILKDNSVDNNTITLGGTLNLGGINLSNQGAGHDTFTDFVSGEHFLQSDITNISTGVGDGLVKSTTGVLSTITDNSSNWNTAYGWGNHLPIFETMVEPTGFNANDENLNGDISFVDGIRQFTISVKGGETYFSFWHSGTEIQKNSSESLIITDVEGEHYIYYNSSGVLSELVDPTSIQIKNLIENEVLVSYIRWDATNKESIWFDDERHQNRMDGSTHSNLHITRGTQYISGLSLGDFLVDQNGNSDTHAQFSISSGVIRDEDISSTNSDINSTTGVAILYKSGINGDWRKLTETGFSVLTDITAGVDITGRLVWNEFSGGSWKLSTVDNIGYVLYHVLATSGVSEKVYTIVGQNTYNNVTEARTGAITEISNLILTGLPGPEYIFIGTVIFQTANTYSNSVKSRIRSTDEGNNYVNWLVTDINITGSNPMDHGNLTGLNDDDHLLYLNKNGRAGGQTAIGGTLTTETLILQDNAIDGNSIIIGSDVDINDLNITNISTAYLKHIQFDTTVSTPSHSEGLLFYDNTNKTLTLYNDESDVALQIGEENWKRVYNNTVSTITNGSVVRINSAVTGIPTIELAKADSPILASHIIGIATHDIETDSTGIVTTFGDVRGLDTSSFFDGDSIYLSSSTAGEFTNIRPAYPNYVIKLGMVVYSHATDGVVCVNVTGKIEDIFENGWNGTFLETIDFTVTSDGSSITGNLEKDGSGNLTMNFSTGFDILDTTPAVTVSLTAGTDTNPQRNYIYIPISTKVLTNSISFWPNEEHIKVARVFLKSASTTQSEGALINENCFEHIAGDYSIGHINHLTERLRLEPIKWFSGVEGTLTINSVSDPDDVYISVTGGSLYQICLSDFPAMDMETGDDIHIVNDSVSPYKTITNLNSETLDSSGNALVNRYFNFVLWGVLNREGETSHLMLNLPTNSYNVLSDAENDVSGYSVYSIPSEFSSVGFLIARFLLYISSSGSGTWTLHLTEDLRGKIPNATAGGGIGGGGTGVTTFLALSDTPSSYSTFGDYFVKVNSGETGLEFFDFDLIEGLYAKLLGRSGGQTLNGSTLTGETLILQDNAIDGNSIIIGSNVNFNELDIDNVGDLIHDDSTASDWTFKNEDLDKDIIFSGNDGGIQTELARFDVSSNRLGIGTTIPDKKLEINSETGDCLRLTYNDNNGSAANYSDLTLSSSGDLTITASGGDISLNESNLGYVGDIFHDDSTASDWIFRNKDSNKNILFYVNDGGVDTAVFYIDGTNSNVRFYDSRKIEFGDGGDFSLRHDGTNSYISNDTGNLNINENTNNGYIALRTKSGVSSYDSIKIDPSVPSVKLHSSHYLLIGNDATELKLYKDGSGNHRIENNYFDFYIQNKAHGRNIYMSCENNSGTQIDFIEMDPDAPYMYIKTNTRLTGSLNYYDTSATDFIIKNEMLNKDILFYVSVGGVSTNAITISGVNGYLGVGTSLPTQQIHLVKEDETNGGICFEVYANTDKKGIFNFNRYGGTYSYPLVVPNGHTLGNFRFNGFNGNALAVGTQVLSNTTELWNTTSNGCSIDFRTIANGTTTSSVNFKIDEDGGIFMSNLLGSTGGSDARYDTVTGELFYDTSSNRYKDNIRDVEKTDKIYNLKVKNYENKKGKTEIGLIAEELETSFPELVNYAIYDVETDEKILGKYKNVDEFFNIEPNIEMSVILKREIDDKIVEENHIIKKIPESVDYKSLIPYLLNEIQYLKNTVENLKTKH